MALGALREIVAPDFHITIFPGVFDHPINGLADLIITHRRIHLLTDNGVDTIRQLLEPILTEHQHRQFGKREPILSGRYPQFLQRELNDVPIGALT